MSQTYCPHGQAVWERCSVLPDIHPSQDYHNIMARLGYRHEDDHEQKSLLNTIVVLLLFGTPVPVEDDQGQNLNEWRQKPMVHTIAMVLKLMAAGINSDSDTYDKRVALVSPGVEALDVLYVYECLKNKPSIEGNPFYHWQKVHRIWREGEQQCPNCWADKEVVEKNFFRWLGAVAAIDDCESKIQWMMQRVDLAILLSK